MISLTEIARFIKPPLSVLTENPRKLLKVRQISANTCLIQVTLNFDCRLKMAEDAHSNMGLN